MLFRSHHLLPAQTNPLEVMISRFFPLWFPVVLITAFSCLSYFFWRKETVGTPQVKLEPKILAGHSIYLSHSETTDPLNSSCRWRLHASPSAIAHFKKIEIAYSSVNQPPNQAEWVRVITCSTDTPFSATLAAPSNGNSYIWLRTANEKETASWSLTPKQ